MHILGVDIGGSGVKGAPVDTKTGQLIADRHRIPTPQPATPAAIAETVAQLAKHFEWDGPIGCGFPAATQSGMVRTASNIDKSWVGTDAATLFGEATGCSAFVANDADVAGLAEMRFGAGRYHKGVVFLITIGTGLGTVMFSNGQLVPNTELGHIILHGDSAKKYASDAVRKKLDLSWKKWARRFDEVLEICRLFWPDLIIIGGGASKKHEKFFKHLTIETEIVPAELRNHAGLIGAALYAEIQSS